MYPGFPILPQTKNGLLYDPWIQDSLLITNGQSSVGLDFLGKHQLFGEKIPIFTNIFQRGWNHQLGSISQNTRENFKTLF